MGSSMGFRALVSRRPAIQATGRLAVAPVRLLRTEHVCLLWTHTSRTITSQRTHLSLAKDAPDVRPIERSEVGTVVQLPEVGGLHHRYTRRAT
jgi:hypothetical protein